MSDYLDNIEYTRHYAKLVGDLNCNINNVKFQQAGENLAKMICATAADSLFGEIAKVDLKSKDNLSRLNEILEFNSFHDENLTAARTASAEGGIYLTVKIDEGISETTPVFEYISSDRVKPTFSGNHLIEADVYTTVKIDNYVMYILVQNYTKGYMYNSLYKCTSLYNNPATAIAKNENIKSIPLNSLEETKDLKETISTQIQELNIAYIPNLRSSRSIFGKSDLDGLEQILNDYSNSYAISKNNLNSSKPLTFVSESLVRQAGKGGYINDVIVMKEDMFDSPDKYPEHVQTVSHDFQANEYVTYQKNLLELVLLLTGTPPSLLGLDSAGGATSAIQEKLKMTRSLIKTAGKARRFEAALKHILYVAMLLDQKILLTAYKDEIEKPSIEFGDGLPEDYEEISSRTISEHNAGLRSRRSSIVRINDTLSEDEIDAELKLLDEEENLTINEINNVIE